MTQVINHKDFDVSEMTGTKPTVRAVNGKDKTVAYMLYKDSPFLLKLPTLYAPFGASSYNNGNGGPTNNYSLNISAKGLAVEGKTSDEEAQSQVKHIFDQLEELDKFMISYGLQYSKTIFGKKYDEGKHEAVVEALFTSTVKHGEDKEGNPYPRRLNTKIRSVYDEPENPNVKVYQNTRTDLNDKEFTFDTLTDLITKGTFVEAVIQPSLWFISGKYGVTWRLVQVKVHKQNGIGVPLDSVFSDDDDDEVVVKKQIKPVKSAETVECVDSDVEEVVEEESGDEDEEVNEV